MFEKFVMPSLEKVSAKIGRTVYHLDGPEEIKHLDMLLSLKYVHAIQWVPLPTTKTDPNSFAHQNFTDKMSLDIYKRTLAAGKKVVLTSVKPYQVPQIYNTVGCDSIFIKTICETRKEADELIAYANKSWIKT